MNDHLDGDLVSQVTEQLASAFRRIRRSSVKELAPYGLTFSQARVLRVLARADSPLRIGDVATRLGIVPRSATSMVDTLETAGLVCRQADPDDRRSVLVALTPEGSGLMGRMHKARRASAEALFAKLDEAQLAQLQGLLAILNTVEPSDGSQAS